MVLLFPKIPGRTKNMKKTILKIFICILAIVLVSTFITSNYFSFEVPSSIENVINYWKQQDEYILMYPDRGLTSSEDYDSYEQVLIADGNIKFNIYKYHTDSNAKKEFNKIKNSKLMKLEFDFFNKSYTQYSVDDGYLISWRNGDTIVKVIGKDKKTVKKFKNYFEKNINSMNE